VTFAVGNGAGGGGGVGGDGGDGGVGGVGGGVGVGAGVGAAGQSPSLLHFLVQSLLHLGPDPE